jgi:3-deoxy-D-manno-octulosonic-acid transferase
MAERRSGGPIVVYRLAGTLVSPFLKPLLRRRVAAGKEDPARLGERFGKSSIGRPSGRVAWIHAASVGETNAAMALVKRIAERGWGIVFTTVTVTGARVAASKLPPGAVHQFAPLDVDKAVRAFLDHWKPDLALFVESELWPLTIARLGAAGIPQVVVNGRLSERSFQRWSRQRWLARRLFGPIALCLAQSEGDAQRFRGVGLREVTVTGNLKFDLPPPSADPKALAALHSAIGRRPIWVAASTHEGEETLVAGAHKELRTVFPTLLTIIAPRHPDRGGALEAEFEESGLVVARRSAGEPVSPETDIYLADTLGELGLFYRLTPIAFLGGSLIPHGGQNPIEAVELNAAILHGPHVHNFAEVYAALDEAGGAEEVGDLEALMASLRRLLGDRSGVAAMAGRGKAALRPFGGALARTLTALKPYLDAQREIAE